MAVRRSPEHIRGALMQVAARRFARDGFDSVNSNQIAREAGVGVGTFYRHFDDKQALADALMLQVWQELGSAMPGADVVESAAFARRATEAVVAYAVDHPDRFRAAFGRARRSNVSVSMRPVERRFREFAERGAGSRDLDAGVAARAWWSMLSGTLVWWLEDPSRATARSLADTLTQLHPMATARATVRHDAGGAGA